MSDPRQYLESWTAKAVLWWVATYTRSVPKQIAEGRREELLSDLYEQYSAAARSGHTRKAASRSIAWRALRGAVADLRWGRVHNQRKAGAVHATTGGPGKSQGFFRGMNAVWTIFAVAFVVSFGAWLLEYFIFHGHLLGHVVLEDGSGYGISGLLILGIAIAFVIARYAQIVAQLIVRKRHSQNPNLP